MFCSGPQCPYFYYCYASFFIFLRVISPHRLPLLFIYLFTHFLYSELHKQLAHANDKNGDMHKKLEGLHKEKVQALEEVSKEMRRAESEASKRRQAESRVRNMESDVRNPIQNNINTTL